MKSERPARRLNSGEGGGVLPIVHRAAVWVGLALLSAVILAIVSPLCPGSPIYSYTDSSVFQYIGSSILDGVMPYRDIFDHKGPLVYLIDAFGWQIHAESGIWLLEVISLIVCSVLWFETAFLLNRSLPAGVLVALLGLVSFAFWSEGGNLTEEYCLPFLSVVLYLYLRGLRGYRVGFPHAVLIGVSCAGVFLIKFNALIFVIPLIVVELVAVRRQGGSLAACLVGGVAGFAVPVALASLWLAANNAFAAFVSDYFVFNLTYAGGAEPIERLLSVVTMLNAVVVVAAFALLGLASFSSSLVPQGTRLCARGVLISFVLGFLLVSSTGYTYGHYYMFFIPSIVFAFAFTPLLVARFDLSIQRIALAFTVVLVAALFCAPSLKSAVLLAKQSVDSTEVQSVLVQEVNNRVDEGDQICVVGNACWVYLQSGTTSASSIAFLPAGIQDYAPWFQALRDDIAGSDVDVVLVSDEMVPLFCDESFLQDFQRVAEAYKYSVYERNAG